VHDKAVAAKDYVVEAGATAGHVVQEKAVAAKDYVVDAGAIVQEKAVAAGEILQEKAVAAKDYVVEVGTRNATLVEPSGPESRFCHMLICWECAPCVVHGPAPHFTSELHGKSAAEIKEAEQQAAVRRASIQAQKVATAAKMADTAPAQQRKNSLKSATSREEVDASLTAAEERRKQLEHAKIEKAASMADTDAARRRKEEQDTKKTEEAKQELARKQGEAESRLQNMQQAKEATHQRKSSQAEQAKAKAAEFKKDDPTSTDVPRGNELPRDGE
jgi:flagellar biosynthesis GTPase FlhF